MHRFFIKTPWWARRLFPSYVWRILTDKKIVYLTFDDGPHPTITPWVMSELRKYNAKATFFCIGDNVLKYPETFQQIIAEGHSIGNHTQHHLNGWKTATKVYLKDVEEATKIINTALFRPPYGKIKKAQANGLKEAMQTAGFKVIMWDVLSADFDQKISAETCIKNVLENIEPGSVVVFHDSQKAWKNLAVALPVILKTLKKEDYEFGKIVMERL